MRKFVCAAFNVWFLLVYLVALCAGQEVTVSDASILLKTVTNETQTSTIDGVKLASTTRQVSAIESTQKVKRLDVDSESKKISIITIPFTPIQKIDDNSFLVVGKAGKYTIIVTSFDEMWQQVAEVTIGDQPPPPHRTRKEQTHRQRARCSTFRATGLRSTNRARDPARCTRCRI